MRDTIDIFTAYEKTSRKAWFQYRRDAFLKSLSVLIRESSNAVAVYLTLYTFKSIHGWNISEMLFLFSLLFISYGILVIFATGLREFESVVKSGDLDRFLLRPRGVLFQIICANSDWFAALGQGGAGIVMFIFATRNTDIHWTFINVIYLIFAVLGGIAIQFSVFLLIACLNIYILHTENIREIFYWNLRKFACYPINVFSGVIQFILVFIVPFAFVNYFPTCHLLHKQAGSQFPAAVYYLTPVVGIILLMLTYLFWRVSLKHYSSTGS